jgi:MoxR-like ATPase
MKPSTVASETASDTLERAHATACDAFAPHLFVALQCDRIETGGSRHSLVDIDRVLLARQPTRSVERALRDSVATLTLGVADSHMSSQHARLVREGARFFLDDARSRNGTRINGALVRGRIPLVDGDVFEAGRTVFVFRAAFPTPADAPPDFDPCAEPALREQAILSTLHGSLARSVVGLRRIANSAVPVLLLGETGTGKEVVARAIHRVSGRAGAFVAVNCGALPPTILEAQLFGHVRGAFSGAVTDALGFLRSADRGTLFLDEIGDLPPAGQVALLRSLQEGEVVPVGGVRPIKTDLRVVAATHRPLEESVGRGEFRSDLFARIAGYTFRVPPLRERREDIGLLVAALTQRAPIRLSPRAGQALLRFDWPLNVRELRHALDVASTLAEGGTIDLEHLPPAVAQAIAKPAAGTDPIQDALVAALSRHRGNVSEVARELGKARAQVHRWLRRFGLDAGSFRR